VHEVLSAAIRRERINNYGVPVDDNMLLIEEYVPHTIEMSCDIATSEGRQYLVGSPVLKKSGGVTGLIEAKHIVGGWLKAAELNIEQIVSGIEKARLASLLMSREHHRIDHVEVMLDERSRDWVITEVNYGRPGGDSLPSVQRVVVGIDPVEVGVKIILGNIAQEQLERIHARSMSSLFDGKVGMSAYFIASCSGRASYDTIAYQQYQNMNTHYVSLSLDVENGEFTCQTMTSYDRCGHYIIKADDFQTLCRCEEQMIKDINFTVN
jgi:hypothetical protein